MFTLFIIFTFVNCVFAQLYTKEDPMKILDHKNFHKAVLFKKHAWIIEFYNSWCGHCINFAPTWKSFAQDILDWEHTIKVGVIDCSANENVPLCREYEIMGYPSMKLFPSNIKIGERGEKISDRTVKGLEDGIIKFLIEQEKKGKGDKSWVNLLEFKGDIADVLKGSPTAESAVVILEEKENNVAEHVILDLGIYPMVYVRKKVVDGNSSNLKLPSVVFVGKDGKQEETFAGTTRQEISAHIIERLNLMKRKSNSGKKPLKNPDKLDGEGGGAGDGPPEDADSSNSTFEISPAPTHAIDQVYLVDIENALSYSLRHEVSLHKEISGEKLDALTNYVRVLIKYLPCRNAVCNFLERFLNYILSKGKSVSGEQISSAILHATASDSLLPTQQPWIGCLGSKPHLRGYPCGLWTTFHTLTVNAAISGENNLDYDPKAVLRAIHGYVKHFFSCEECSRNFQYMYGEDAETFTKSVNDEVMWLWKGHNKVNKRLHGDLSEDPQHKKEPFPSWGRCPSCWKHGEEFDLVETLKYLKKIYAKESLSLEGTQNITSSQDEKQRIKLYEKSIFEKNLSSNWGFNTFDMNMCVVLYGFSTLIIICGYFMFIARKHFRRRRLDLFRV